MLDDGEFFDPQEFQLVLVEDLFAGVQQNWWILPEGNGKTTFLGHLGLYFGDYTPSAMVPIAASSREQAEVLYRQAEGFVYRTPGMLDRFKCQEGYRRIKCLRTSGRLQVFAADDRTGDGIIPGGIALVDELHRLRDLRLWRLWTGKLNKRHAQIVGISTAGEPGSEFETVRGELKATADEVLREPGYVRAASPGMVLHDFHVDPDGDIDDMEVVKQANPFPGITPETLRAKRDSPTMTEGHWRRFVCNISTVEEGSWLPSGAWDACFDQDAEIPDGSEVWVGVDIGRKHDRSAVAVVWPDGDRYVVKATVLSQGAALADVEQEIRAVNRLYRVEEVAFDPWSFARSGELLEDEGLPVVEHPQSPERMHIASSRLYEAVMTKQIVHDGDPVLAAHVAAGATKDTERGWRLVKNPRAKRPIDALMALAMAFNRASSRPVDEPWVMVV